jgi:two-component system, NarL family, response regulator NreC
MRIVLAENELMFRDALRLACVENRRHEVVGEASDGEEAVRVVTAAQPEVLLLEIDLPRLDGFAVAETLRQQSRLTQIIAVTAARGSYTVFRIERCNFHGYVDKGTNPLSAVREAIAAAEAGRRYFAPQFTAAREERMRDPKGFDKVLSERELEVLGYIGRSMNDDEIGATLGIAARTVETFRHRILQKLGIAGTPKLIRYALEKGFTPMSAVMAPPLVSRPAPPSVSIPPSHFTPGARIRRRE